MADTAYTYAVARIRAKEANLFSDGDIMQLLSCKTYENCINFLHEKGWGTENKDETQDEILSYETEKTWKEVKSLVPSEDVFSVLMIPREYHNLKTAIKQVCTGDEAENVYYGDLSFTPLQLKEMVEKRNFISMSNHMAKAAEEATETLLQTQDGQLCDIIIDKAAMEAMQMAAKQSKSEFIKQYVDEFIAVADIRIALRSAKTGKNRDFMERAMCPSDKISMTSLINAAQAGVTQICDYLSQSGYAEAADCIQESSSSFERWCDNKIIETIKTQKYNCFSEGPILSYILARENEIKTVRIILTGKHNGLNDDFIKERIRIMYV